MDYRITDYGAVVSDALQTEAIQKAIDTCFLAGGGRVIIPAGIFRRNILDAVCVGFCQSARGIHRTG